MSATRRGIQHTFAVGRFTCTITLPTLAEGLVMCSAEWTPSVPCRQLTASEQRQYEAGRAEAIRLWLEASKASGLQG